MMGYRINLYEFSSDRTISFDLMNTILKNLFKYISTKEE